MLKCVANTGWHLASYVSLGVMQVLKQAHTKNLTVSDYYTSKERIEVAASILQ